MRPSKHWGGSIQSIAVVIGWGLLILFFSEPLAQLSLTKPQLANGFMTIALVLIVITSFYCLQILIFRIRDVLVSLSS